jgi:hypothetical protein
MIHDPILDEVRSIREAIAQEHDYDVSAIFAMFRQNAATSSRVHVNLSASPSISALGAAQLGVAADESSPRR